ncbi:MAG: PAS domain S-box protein, partial [Bacteroidota bacterium]
MKTIINLIEKGEISEIENNQTDAPEFARLGSLVGSLFHQIENSRIETEQNRVSAEALQKSEARFYAMFEMNPAPMALLNINTWEYADVNKAFTDSFGYTREEVIASTPDQLNIFVSKSSWLVIQRSVINDSYIKNYQVELREKSGNSRIMLLYGIIISNLGERLLLTTTIDLTLRIKSEQTLIFKKQLERLLTTISTSLINAKPVEVNGKIEEALIESGKL